MGSSIGLAAGVQAKKRSREMWIVLLLLLAVFSFIDIRKKALPLWALLAGIVISALVAVVRNWAEGDGVWAGFVNVATGMLPGMIMTLLAVVLRENLGSGDGLVLIVIGNLMGPKVSLLIWTAAIMLSFLFSLFLLVFLRKNKNDCFPFVPFYLGGAVLVRLFFLGGG